MNITALRSSTRRPAAGLAKRYRAAAPPTPVAPSRSSMNP